MKKLSVILSVILCLSMMTMGVSAQSAGEILTGDDAFAIYEKCVNKMSKIQYLELRAFMKTTESEPGARETKMTRDVADYRFAVDERGMIQAEAEMWDASGEKTDHLFIDGGYLYDHMEYTRYFLGSYTMREQIYTLTGAEPYDYKSNIKNIRAEKLEKGYRVWYYSTSYSYYDDDKYTLFISDDFRLESVTNTFNYSMGYFSSSYEENSYRYEILSVDRPFKIKFPASLSSYETKYF